MIPKARKNNLQIRQVGDELSVYDQTSNETVCVDQLTALVYSKCDGANSPWEIQRVLREAHGQSIDEDAIWNALTALKQLNLLDDDGDDSIERYRGHLENRATRNVSLKLRMSTALVNLFGGKKEPLLVQTSFTSENRS